MSLNALYSIPGLVYIIAFIGMIVLMLYVYPMAKNTVLRAPALFILGLTIIMAVTGIVRLVYPSKLNVMTDIFLIAVFYTGVGWFYFISEFISYKVDRRIIFALVGIYTFLAIVAVTNGVHGLFATYKPIYFDGVLSVVVLNKEGPFFLLLAGVTYPMFLAGLLLLFREWIYTENTLRKKQIFYVFVGSIVPIVADFIATIGHTNITIPFEPILVSFAFVTAPSYMYAVFSYSFIKSQPLTREKVVQNLDYGVFTLSSDLTILDVNTSGLDLFGFSSIKAANFNKFPESVQNRITKFIEAEAEVESDELNVEINGDSSWLRLKLVRVPLSEDLDQVAMTVAEITEEKQRMEELIIKNKRLDQFSRVVSHDMRNYINIGDSYLRMVKEEIDDDDLIEWIEPIEESFNNINSIVDDASDITKIGKGEISTVDFEHVTLEIIDQIDPDIPVTVDLDITKQADRGSVRRLIENLIQNSLTHGGEELSKISIKGLDSADGFYVADDGEGFDNVEKVFESGYTTSDTGSGLGLNISQTVVDLHNWEITASESDTGGAKFEIVFN